MAEWAKAGATRNDFADMMDQLSADQLGRPTLCEALMMGLAARPVLDELSGPGLDKWRAAK